MGRGTDEAAGATQPGRGAGLAARLARLSLFLSQFMAIQLVVQGLGFVAGFIIIRALSKQEYALYTLTASAIATVVAVTNSGIVAGVMAYGGQVWQDKERLGRILAAAYRIRRRNSILFGLSALAVFASVTGLDGATWLELLALMAIGAVVAEWQLTLTIESAVLRLHARIGDLQRLDLLVSGARTALVALLFPLLDAVLGTVASLPSLAAGLWLVKKKATPLVDRAQPRDYGLERQFSGVVARQWFNEVYNSVQGQTAVLLLGVFGRPEAVANVGALGRIAVVFSLYTAVMQTIVLPRYARVQDPAERHRLYVTILVGFAVAAALPVGAALLAPQPILWVLGAQYGNLSQPLVLVMLNASVGAVAGLTWWLNGMRAWMLPAWINVPAGLGSQLLAMAVIGVSTLDRVLLVGIVSGLFMIVVNVAATIVFSRRAAERAAGAAR